MRDLLCAIKVSPDFCVAMNVYLIETSEKLIEQQRSVLSGDEARWVSSLNEVPAGPVILIANEFLDVLPIRQYVKAGDKWSERVIVINEKGNLNWALGTGVLANDLLPGSASDEADGAVLEVSTTREAFISNVADCLNMQGGVALFIDYGHGQTGVGDTFQAMKAHEYVDPLLTPGEADLTSHVDFEPLIKIANIAGLEAEQLVTQGEFLLGLGLLERAGQLGFGKSEEVQQRLVKEAERLALPHEMGDLFKVLGFKNIR